MEITVTTKVTIPDTIDPIEAGRDMVGCALAQWYQYDDEGTFQDESADVNGETYYSVADPDEGKRVEFTATQFFAKHVELIWLATIDNYRHDWIDFAFKSSGADADEYDANTCDAVLQNMLYGSIVYG